MVTMLASATLPVEVARAGTPADDLKQIEYRYYFRGKYQQAIEALRTFLARVDLSQAETTRAREFLAASYVLGGAPAMGREVFAQIIVARPSYAGPDPAVFKLDVINAYAEARAEYNALALRNVPAAPADTTSATVSEPAARSGTPIYKKWWLYAGAAAVAALAVGVAGGGEDSNPPPSGTLVVGVRVQ
jgi:hypothetical protein